MTLSKALAMTAPRKAAAMPMPASASPSGEKATRPATTINGTASRLASNARTIFAAPARLCCLMV